MQLPVYAIVLVAILLLAILLLGVGTAYTTVRLIAARDAQGARKPLGCLAGAALGLGLFLLALLGLGILAASMTLLSVGNLLASNPVRRVRVVAPQEDASGAERALFAPPEDVRELEPWVRDPERPLHVIFEIQGGRAPVDELAALVRRFSSGEVQVQLREGVDGAGRPIVLVDVALPVDRNDLREIEQGVRRHLPEASWGEGLLIELRAVHRDW